MDRRGFVRGMMATGAMAGGINFFGLITEALAASHEKGIISIKGNVRINGSPAKKGAMVASGDAVTTGGDSSAVFAVGKNGFLIRDNSHVEIALGNTGLIEEIRILGGKLLSVFEKGSRKIMTTTALAGVRGSAMYVEAEPDVTYICLCYGEAAIESLSYPGVSEIVSAKHHEYPKYILGACAGKPMLPAPMLNHTDVELEMLEALFGRKTPFARKIEEEERDHGY